ncbi:CxxxxCH/CxxCH domain-containing protein, partial [Geobacter luticola]|nr:CxxxxCH/CxxCH domain-containing protein [Geomobilimonas luticola]
SSAFNSAPFLRSLNERDEMCLDCHRQRNSTSHLSGSHPVTVSYSGAASARPAAFYSEPVNSNPGNPTSALKLVGGEVLCSTCHRVHFADSASATYDSATSARQGHLTPSGGKLLRTDLRGASA